MAEGQSEMLMIPMPEISGDFWPFGDAHPRISFHQMDAFQIQKNWKKNKKTPKTPTTSTSTTNQPTNLPDSPTFFRPLRWWPCHWSLVISVDFSHGQILNQRIWKLHLGFLERWDQWDQSKTQLLKRGSIFFRQKMCKGGVDWLFVCYKYPL